MQNQINVSITNFLSPYLCSYRKGYNTQQALLALTEKWKKNLDDKGFGGAVLTDLSKAFETINHDLIVEFNVHGFQNALKLICSYLINRLEHDSLIAIEWFENNDMKLNQEKYHLLVFGQGKCLARIQQRKIWESGKQKLLFVEIEV